MKINILIIFAIISLSACYYNNEEDLLGNTTCTTTNMSYKTDILPILNNNCNGCHSTAAKQGNVILDSYTEVKKYATSGSLYGSVAHQTGFSAMPKNGAKLDDCSLKKIDAWIKDGAKDN